MRKTAFPLTVLLIAIIFFSCSDKKEPKSPQKHNSQKTFNDKKPVYGDKIIVGSIGDISNLIPILATDSASHQIAGLIYNGLLKYDKNLELVGDLAESFSISKNNKRN